MLDQVPKGEVPSTITKREHEEKCRSRFLGATDKGQRAVFDTIRALRNPVAHLSWAVSAFRDEHSGDRDSANDAMMDLRTSCLSLIHAIDARKTPPDDDQHVLEGMMSPLEGREVAFALARQVIEALESWTPPTGSQSASPGTS